MNLPVLILSKLPDLNVLTAVFEAAKRRGPGFDDTIIILAALVYESCPPSSCGPY